jgi:two-component system chemotaxis response regulator CheY
MKPKKKIRVMIVEDEDHARKLIKTVVKNMNCEIVGETNNGKDAVSMYYKLKPTMLLLDINMPIQSGKKALAEIRKKFPNTFIIMLTSLSDSETIEDCIKLGTTGFIRKDLPIDEMRKVIKQTWSAYKSSLQ